MSTKIYYFSGTGNSLFIAQKLKESIKDSELLPIIKALKEPDRVISVEKIVFVFPIYALTVPLPVREFLKRFIFKDVQYFSAVATRLGLYFNDFKRINNLLKPYRLNSHFLINMGSNDVKVKDYTTPSINDIESLEDIALTAIKEISKVITNSKESLNNDENYLEPLPFGDFRDKILEWLIPKMMTFSRFIGGVNYFYTNNKCNSCSICSRVCLSGKISMDIGYPKWDKRILCHMCYACINYCPVKAIEIDSIPGVPSYSRENERYSHPYAGYKEIQNQKG